MYKRLKNMKHNVKSFLYFVDFENRSDVKQAIQTYVDFLKKNLIILKIFKHFTKEQLKPDNDEIEEDKKKDKKIREVEIEKMRKMFPSRLILDKNYIKSILFLKNVYNKQISKTFKGGEESVNETIMLSFLLSARRLKNLNMELDFDIYKINLIKHCEVENEDDDTFIQPFTPLLVKQKSEESTFNVQKVIEKDKTKLKDLNSFLSLIQKIQNSYSSIGIKNSTLKSKHFENDTFKLAISSRSSRDDNNTNKSERLNSFKETVSKKSVRTKESGYKFDGDSVRSKRSYMKNMKEGSSSNQSVPN